MFLTCKFSGIIEKKTTQDTECRQRDRFELALWCVLRLPGSYQWMKGTFAHLVSRMQKDERKRMAFSVSPSLFVNYIWMFHESISRQKGGNVTSRQCLRQFRNSKVKPCCILAVQWLRIWIRMLQSGDSVLQPWSCVFLSPVNDRSVHLPCSCCPRTENINFVCRIYFLKQAILCETTFDDAFSFVLNQRKAPWQAIPQPPPGVCELLVFC